MPRPGGLVAVPLGGGAPRPVSVVVRLAVTGGPATVVGLQSGVVGPQGGVVGLEGCVVGLQVGGVPFQVEDLADPGEVDPLVGEFGDPTCPAEVVTQ